ncbi:permease prefix domain 1-containing protein [Rossellomorea sp. AcN35-11]|nr:permease prefix domain 1-containing protein [Rossellomorea aquimaris]WJV29714.1 permease prefix domain 1-containing protein [Rossellomorea sp. AcN35-11]
MKQIDLFVDSVYKNVGGNKKEIQELRAEMKNHLLEAVHELKSEGKSEQEAIELAIDRFGGENEMRSVVGQLFKAQKMFAKWVLNLAIVFLLLSSVGFGFLWVVAEQNSHDISNDKTEIFNILHSNETISEDMQKEIEGIVKGSEDISQIQVYNVRDIKGDAESYSTVFEYVENAKPDYQFERNIWSPEWLFALYPSREGDSEWYVNMEIRYNEPVIGSILFVGFAVYITLFTIWATINAYHHRRLNIGWILAFALLNVVGYLIYALIGRKTKQAATFR